MRGQLGKKPLLTVSSKTKVELGNSSLGLCPTTMAAIKTKYPWNEVSRLQLVVVVNALKGQGKGHGLKWREVSRHLEKEYDVEDGLFGKLCSKQYDNLFRAYLKFKEDGIQPPRLSSEIIEAFDGHFPGSPSGGKALGGDTRAGSQGTASSNPDATTQSAEGKKLHPKYPWTTASKLKLLEAIRVAATMEGKIHWVEVTPHLADDGGLPEDMLSMLCAKQFNDLSLRFKEFKLSGNRSRRLTPEIIEKLDELYQVFPNLNPLPEQGQDICEDEMRLSRPVISGAELETRSSSEHDRATKSIPESERPPASKEVPREELEIRSSSEHGATESIPESEHSLASKEVPAVHVRTGEEEAHPPTNEIASLGKRGERADMSSSQTDMSSHEDHKDQQEVGFERMEKELSLLNSWLKQEVLPVGREVLCRVQAHGTRCPTVKKREREPRDDFDRLIYEASQKSIILNIRAQFQQARANILKEVKETIERVGMDLLSKRTAAIDAYQVRLHTHERESPLEPPAGPSRPG